MQLKFLDSITVVHCNMHVADDAGAGEVGDWMPKRGPLTQRGLSKQEYEALQLRETNKTLAAAVRKPLCLEYPPGRPTTTIGKRNYDKSKSQQLLQSS